MARKSAASPLAVFLDHILTAPIGEARAALEASTVSLAARERVVAKLLPNKPAVRLKPETAVASPAAAPIAGPVAAPAAPVRERKKPGRRPGQKNRVLAGPGAPSAAPATATATETAPRRRRPAVMMEAPAVAATPVAEPAIDLPGGAPLPDQTVDYDVVEEQTT